MAIRQTTITLTIMHREEDDVPNWDFETIAGEWNEGSISGYAVVTGTVEVTDAAVAERLDEMGQPASFFDD